MKSRIAIFKAGTHRAENGQVIAFSDADVAGMATSYDPALLKSPIVIGHPKTNDPAYGWAAGLEIENGLLYAETEKVMPEFAELVDAGRYGNISISVYGPNDHGNPKPGGYYLRHIGFLGAKAPSVKGLGMAFAEGATADDDEFLTFSDMELSWLASNVAQGFRSIRDWILAKFGQDEADKALSAWTDQAANTIAAETRADRPGFAEDAPDLAAAQDAITAREAELTARETAIAAREAATNADLVAFAEQSRSQARAADVEYVDGLVTAGRLPPGHANQTKILFGVLSGDPTISFAEGDPPARELLRALLDGLGTAIAFGEFSAGDGRDVEATPVELAARTRTLVNEATARGESLSFAEAAARVRAS